MLRNHSHTGFLASVGSIAIFIFTLGAGISRAQSVLIAPSADTGAEVRTDDPYADRFPNLVLKTHEGKTVRFYEDLLKGKIVLINFMYATCEDR